MKARHLSAAQLEEMTARGATGEEQRHLLNCAECRAEMDSLRAVLAGFRRSARDWSDREFRPEAYVCLGDARGRALRQRRVRWALAAVVLMVSLGIPVGQRLREQDRLREAATDAVLMTQVDQQISRTVPGSMESLAELVSWDGPATGNKGRGQ